MGNPLGKAKGAASTPHAPVSNRPNRQSISPVAQRSRAGRLAGAASGTRITLVGSQAAASGSGAQSGWNS
jgi:hypothetical protein